jgi:predicted enzyme related to lactoylglutathione lyase
MAQHGEFVWNELIASDPERARAFFSETLGWTFQSFEVADTPTYWVAWQGEKMVAGLGGLGAGYLEDSESYWVGFIEVDEIDRRFARAVELGATPVRDPVVVPEIGRVAVLRDPTGALIGWMTSAG